MLKINSDYKKFFNTNNFNYFFSLNGDVAKKIQNRLTQKIEVNNQFFYIKKHHGIGYKEILKNLLQFKLPVINAYQEWQAINKLKKINVNTMDPVAVGIQGLNPACQKSFLITKDLGENIALDKYLEKNKIDFSTKKQLIKKLAKMASRMHQHGINHRDFYLCHFLCVNFDIENLYLIDLHRAQCRNNIPFRWRVKDIAALYFSARNFNLSRTDILRFIKYYDFNNKNFWQAVQKKYKIFINKETRKQ